jgi:alpha-L-rhamnosidase
MGLLDLQDWSGKWIGLDEATAPISFTEARWIWTYAVPPASEVDPLTRYFRGTVEIPPESEAGSGRLLIASSGGFMANVNGVRILEDSAPGTARDVDVRWRLKLGRNVVAFSPQPEHPPALPTGITASLEIELMDCRRMVVSTGSQWKASAFPSAEEEGSDFDDPAWTPALALAEAGGPPWGLLLRPSSRRLSSRRLSARWLRREFSADRAVRRTIVYYCGLGNSELYINGKRVGDEVLSPGLSEIPERAFDLTHDVTSLIRVGRNAMGVVLGNGRYYAPRKGAPYGDVNPKLML